MNSFEIKECVICGRKFERATARKHGKLPIYVRGYKYKTCSKKCAKINNLRMTSSKK